MRAPWNIGCSQGAFPPEGLLATKGRGSTTAASTVNVPNDDDARDAFRSARVMG